ncbi:MAG TPA: MarR family transcriptional regulator [Spongiibacteraceae bacterium]|nr:MarR family transcriptional regulator [Spongiibacteraceae bacterium]
MTSTQTSRKTPPPARSKAAARETVLAQFSRNLPRHIIGVAQALNERLVAQCVAAGHAGLRVSFNPVLAELNSTGIRIVDIANSCHITQQAAGQLVGELEKLGYVKRKPDSNDKRAKQLVLTAKGERLLGDSARFAGAIEQDLTAAIGDAALAKLQDSCSELYTKLVHNSSATEKPRDLTFALAGIATYCETQLMELDKLKGHSRLKMSFSQVISHISPHGSLINDLAKINGVSKQAISQVVKEVEDLGYIERKQNPHDARSTQLFLTDYGLQLIADSVANISVLRTQLIDVLGERRLQEFSTQIETSYEYFSSASAQLLDESQRLRIESALQHSMAMLYRDGLAAEEQKLLFSRSGNRVRWSATALEILKQLEIKVAK